MMMNFRNLARLTCFWMVVCMISGLVFGTVSGALAGELRYGKDQCFTRHYSDAHLKKNPRQQVVAMRLVHRPSTYDDALKILSQGQQGRAKEQWVQMDVGLRDGRTYRQNVICTLRGNQRFCGVECDGGRFAYRFKKDGAMLVDFRSTGGMSMNSTCGEEVQAAKGYWLGEAKDDQLFRLDLAPMSACVDLR